MGSWSVQLMSTHVPVAHDELDAHHALVRLEDTVEQRTADRADHAVLPLGRNLALEVHALVVMLRSLGLQHLQRGQEEVEHLIRGQTPHPLQ
ncbi:MAG: hypothetical protein KBD29_00140 [Candidatus Magasanikbacteria bacterium]|nr:hypothetical protein [Candidatus Magasanikbacteria bacterium]